MCRGVEDIVGASGVAGPGSLSLSPGRGVVRGRNPRSSTKQTSGFHTSIRPCSDIGAKWKVSAWRGGGGCWLQCSGRGGGVADKQGFAAYNQESNIPWAAQQSWRMTGTWSVMRHHGDGVRVQRHGPRQPQAPENVTLDHSQPPHLRGVCRERHAVQPAAPA
eukprot:gene25151-biopygen5983